MHTIPRVIVTGHKAGKSVIVSDEKANNVSEHIPGLIISDIWATDSMPVNLAKQTRFENSLFPQTPSHGSYVRYVQIPPDSSLPEELRVNMNHGEPHPFMHQTQTLDYIIILSGELYLILEEGETLLRAGDMVIQRGTNHAWSNRSDKPCIQ